jgi:RNA methyltransferase, TrmH family
MSQSPENRPDVPAYEAMAIAAFNQARESEAKVILEGFHALKHAIRFGATIELAVTADYDMLLRLAAQLAPDVASQMKSIVTPVAAGIFQILSASTPIHTKTLAIALHPPAPADDSLSSIAAEGPVVLLEDPRNFGNIGAVVRVAAAANARAVVTTGISDPWDRAALRGSAGLHYALPVWRSRLSLPEGIELIALDPDGEDIAMLDLPNYGVFAFGTEREGLSTEILERATIRAAIPMRSGVSSLNLATSVAVVLFMLRLRRSAADSQATSD